MKSALAATVILVTLIQGDPVAPIVARLDAYLNDYEPKLSTLIADEILEQEARLPRADLRRRDDDRLPVATRVRRRLSSEVAFIALPDQAGWLGFRRVKSVDNRAVEDRGSLSAALASTDYDAARRLLAASAANNLGLPRTINLPNLPLEFLHQRNRRRLVPRLDGHERVRGADTTLVLWTERSRPTLIQNPNGGDMPSVIRTWSESASGALMRAEVTTFASWDRHELQAQIRVEFSHNKTHNLLVPFQMRETFPTDGPSPGIGRATYTNFRRFQTSARIVPQ